MFARSAMGGYLILTDMFANIDLILTDGIVFKDFADLKSLLRVYLK